MLLQQYKHSDQDIIKPHNLQVTGQYEQHNNVIPSSLIYCTAEHKPILRATNGPALEI